MAVKHVHRGLLAQSPILKGHLNAASIIQKLEKGNPWLQNSGKQFFGEKKII